MNLSLLMIFKIHFTSSHAIDSWQKKFQVSVEVAADLREAKIKERDNKREFCNTESGRTRKKVIIRDEVASVNSKILLEL